MRWLASQYGLVWDAMYSASDKGTQELLDRRLDFLQDHGNLSGRPVSAPLEDGIFELRANKVRMLFYFGQSRNIVFVHGIIKTTRKIPREAIELAKKRRVEILAGEVNRNALPN